MKSEAYSQSLIPGLPDDIGLSCLMRVPFCYHSSLKAICHRWNTLFSNRSFYEQRRSEGRGEDLVCLTQVMTPDRLLPPVKENSGIRPTQYRFTIYNASEDTWSRLPESPLLPAGIPFFSQCVAVAGKLIVLGGWDPTTLETVRHVYVCDLVKGGGWSRGASMATVRSFFACAVVGSLVYVAGGHDNHKNALRSCEVYDAESDTWHTMPDMSQERDECVGFSTGDGRYFWVLSGYRTDSQGRFDSSAEVLDRCDGGWTRFDNIWPVPHMRPHAVCYVREPQDQGYGPEFPPLWFMGLASSGEGEAGRGMREYDARERKWKMVGPIPEDIRSSPCLTVLSRSGESCGRVFMMATSHIGFEDVLCTAFVSEVGSKKWTKLTVPHEFSGYVHAACTLHL